MASDKSDSRNPSPDPPPQAPQPQRLRYPANSLLRDQEDSPSPDTTTPPQGSHSPRSEPVTQSRSVPGRASAFSSNLSQGLGIHPDASETPTSQDLQEDQVQRPQSASGMSPPFDHRLPTNRLASSPYGSPRRTPGSHFPPSASPNPLTGPLPPIQDTSIPSNVTSFSTEQQQQHPEGLGLEQRALTPERMSQIVRAHLPVPPGPSSSAPPAEPSTTDSHTASPHLQATTITPTTPSQSAGLPPNSTVRVNESSAPPQAPSSGSPHLPSSSASSQYTPGTDTPSGEDQIQSAVPYQLPGAAITSEIYKWVGDQQQEATAQGAPGSWGGAPLGRTRSKSIPDLRQSIPGVMNAGSQGPSSPHLPPSSSAVPGDASGSLLFHSNAHHSGIPTASSLRLPGGFRRHFIRRQAQASGAPEPNIITRNFLDFLALYGHFAGDDFPDDGEEEEEEEEGEGGEGGLGGPYAQEEGLRRRPLIPSSGRRPTDRLTLPGPTDESSPLLGRVTGPNGTPIPVSPATPSIPPGTASPGKVFFLLMKSFVGTGVLFLPRSFYNGGLAFSSIFLCSISYLCLYSMLLLVECRAHITGSFGDIGGKLYGPRMRKAVLSSIAISQVGFCCAYTIFVAKNLRDFLMLVSDCGWIVPEYLLVFAQLGIYVPFALVRKIKNLSFLALIADVFIVGGIGYLYYYDITTLMARGPAVIRHFNTADFALFIGTAVFTFEGIGLVIPIRDSMKEPQRFPMVLSRTMVLVTFIFCTVGGLSYLTFGDKVETVVLLNLPSGSRAVELVQLFYTLAILFSVPLQMFPAIGILENSLFTPRSGKRDPRVKWTKNTFRLGICLLIAVIAFLGSSSLDRFVTLIGAIACIPLSFVYPALFHYKALARSAWSKRADLGIVAFGLCCMVFCTFTTVYSWLFGEQEPEFNRCAGRTVPSFV
ncbi:MAG: transmembrane amino acid transporter protein-domain-containing protein [Piptocephalis tieghemiana]|nr:MAG: transmembrane amino acid transporter protein-domain-containing protein [Piptocephalis tieghemiana]